MMRRLLCGALVMVTLLGIFPVTAFAEEPEQITADGAAAYMTESDGDYKAWSAADTRWKDLTLGTTTSTVKSAGSTVVAFTKMVIQSRLKKESEFDVADCVALLNSTSGAFRNAELAWGKAAGAIEGLKYSMNKDVSTLSAEEIEAEILKQVQEGYHIILQSTKYHYLTVDRTETLAENKVYILDSLADTALNSNMLLSDSGYTINHIYLFTAAEHLYVQTSKGDPTCTEKGYIESVCSICGDVQKEELAALGHTFASEVIAPTYSGQGYTLYTCTRCGYSYKTDYTGKLSTYDDGWVQENGSWYYYKENIRLTGWLKDSGKWYYLGSDGAMKTGWIQDGGSRYYLNRDGTMKTGWLRDNGKWYYLNRDGSMASGWLKCSGKWYYLNTDGTMQTGWLKWNNNWYYLNAGGAMLTGWQKVGKIWYDFEADGTMQTGWKIWSDSTYYLKNSGELASGWVKISGSWYYFDPAADGAMQTGWKTIDGKTYFLRNDGTMKAKSWGKSDGKYYYFDSDGAMVTGTAVISGKTYYFEADGSCTNYS